MALVSIRHLTRIFDVSKPWLNRLIERRPRALLTAVSDVSFEIEEKTVYALVGESGSGKSTIGKMLVGLLRPSEGVVEIRGTDLARESLERRRVEGAGAQPDAPARRRARVGVVRRHGHARDRRVAHDLVAAAPAQRQRRDALVGVHLSRRRCGEGGSGGAAAAAASGAEREEGGEREALHHQLGLGAGLGRACAGEDGGGGR